MFSSPVSSHCISLPWRKSRVFAVPLPGQCVTALNLFADPKPPETGHRNYICQQVFLYQKRKTTIRCRYRYTLKKHCGLTVINFSFTQPCICHISTSKVSFYRTILQSVEYAFTYQLSITKIFPKTTDVIAPVLSSLNNEAVASVSYPNLFKAAGTTSIHRSVSEFDFEKYRLISVSFLFNKVFKRTLHSIVSKFYQKYKNIYQAQSGCLKSK